MLRDASDYGVDGSLLEGFTMDDIDLNTLKTYRMEYELHNPEHIWNGIGDKEFLRNLGGYTVNRITCLLYTSCSFCPPVDRNGMSR